MNERDVRLLFDADHWSGASVVYIADDKAWRVYINALEKDEQEMLTLKTGTPRNFKTSDTAIHWCHEIGFKKIAVHLSPTKPANQKDLNKTLKIVLIEDNPDDIELTLRVFQGLNANINVLVLEDGAEATDFLFAKGKYQSRQKSELPKIILLDLNLPKLDGHEVLRQIRADGSTKHIPVVVLSTSTEESDISLSYELGSNSYINKPVNYKAFCNALEKIGRYWLDVNSSNTGNL